MTTNDVANLVTLISPEGHNGLQTAALWYNADRPGEVENALAGTMRTLKAYADEMSYEMGPINTVDLEAGHPEIAAPPRNLGGTPRCIVAACAMRPKRVAKLLTEVNAFTHELDTEDLEKLRHVTRFRYKLDAKQPEVKRLYHHPVVETDDTPPELTDEECDAIINEYGIEVAQDQLETLATKK